MAIIRIEYKLSDLILNFSRTKRIKDNIGRISNMISVGSHRSSKTAPTKTK